MSVCGQNPALHAKNPRSQLMFILQCPLFQFQPGDFLTFMWILLVLCPLVTMIDRTTRWPEVVPMSSISAESCVHAFISAWVARFGVPAVLTSDRGSQFMSSMWTGVCSVLGISASTTTSFHPQSNGMVERFHRSLKSSLRARLAGSDWFSYLPLVLLGLRVTRKDDTCPQSPRLFMVLH